MKTHLLVKLFALHSSTSCATIEPAHPSKKTRRRPKARTKPTARIVASQWVLFSLQKTRRLDFGAQQHYVWTGPPKVVPMDRTNYSKEDPLLGSGANTQD